MTNKQELFKFMSTRRLEQNKPELLNWRLIRDRRSPDQNPVLQQLFGAGSYAAKLAAANNGRQSARFVLADSPEAIALSAAASFLRAHLEPNVPFSELITALGETYTMAEPLLRRQPPDDIVDQANELLSRLWDSLYVEVTRGFDRYVSTNYLADGIRVYHVLRLAWLMLQQNHNSWQGLAFDDYDLVITPPPGEQEAGRVGTAGASLDQEIGRLTRDVAELDDLARKLDVMIAAGEVELREVRGKQTATLDCQAAGEIAASGVSLSVDVATASIDALSREINERRTKARARLQRRRMDRTLAARRKGQRLSLARPQRGAANRAAASGQLDTSFRVDLGVGAIRPPMTGDLLRVEQELRGYEEGDLARIENVMKGEQREHSRRELSRTTQSSSRETESETTVSESTVTDERFQMASASEQAAQSAFSADVGINVTGKYGPVQVGVSANASYSQSKSSSDSVSQEFARQVTETASRSVRERIKETSSMTVLSETESTALHGFNNQQGEGHVSGVYRWIDRICAERVVNYGRRLMLTFEVPEPALFMKGLLERSEQEVLETLTEPVPPSNYYWYNGELRQTEPGHELAFDSHLKIDAENYAALAAVYGVTGIEPPPPDKITGSKAISYPLTSEAGEVTDHNAAANELSYVASDNTLKVDPDYKVTRIGVWAPKGVSGAFGWYADSLKLGQNNNDENRILVLVGSKSFYFSAVGTGNNNPIEVETNFNQTQEVGDDELFSGVVEPALPITLQADFEGLLTFTVIYTAFLRAAAYERWQIATYGAITQGYERLRRDFDQQKAIMDKTVEDEKDKRVMQLRDAQYRAIERTELKRGCIELMTEGTALGFQSVALSTEGRPLMLFDPPTFSEGWRAPIQNGSVATFFEQGVEWDNMVYTFYPYYWADVDRWQELAESTSNDPVFEEFCRSGMASVTVPVTPGFERSMMVFLKTSRIWGGGYLPLYDTQDILDVYADVEQGLQLDPPEQVGDSWDVRLPTSMVMLQPDSVLPQFDVSFEDDTPDPNAPPALPIRASTPF